MTKKAVPAEAEHPREQDEELLVAMLVLCDVSSRKQVFIVMAIPAVGACPACPSRAGGGSATAKGLAEGRLETDHHFGLIFCSVTGSYCTKLVLRAAGPQRTIPAQQFVPGRAQLP